MIAIVDYGVGNINNIINAFERLGCPLILTDDLDLLSTADGIILPGVGAFDYAAKKLKEKSLDQGIQALIKGGKPLLGICLGMQLLCQGSYENTYTEGLGIFKGTLRGFDENHIAPIPHMGWQDVHYCFESEAHQTDNKITCQDAYFVHSYYLDDYDPRQCIGWSTYQGQKIPCVMKDHHVMGIQFHPEKSSAFGEQWLRYFIRLCQKEALC